MTVTVKREAMNFLKRGFKAAKSAVGAIFGVRVTHSLFSIPVDSSCFFVFIVRGMSRPVPDLFLKPISLLTQG